MIFLQVPLKSSSFIAEFQTNSSSFFSLSCWNKDFSSSTRVNSVVAVKRNAVQETGSG